MGLFKRKPMLCPMCQSELGPSNAGRGEHWLSHVTAHDDGFGWKCPCGPTSLVWSKDIKAAAALAIHMFKAHSIKVEGIPQLAATIQLSDHYDGFG